MLVSDCLNWIDSQRDRMVALVSHWAGINSGTLNREGVEQFARAILPEFSTFGVKPQLLDVPPFQSLNNRGAIVPHPLGPALNLRVRPSAKRRVLLAIHHDTVYGPDSDFQTVEYDRLTMHGPGVADAKGGIAVLLIALEALEQFLSESDNPDFGWEVLLNPDEEIGSPGSNDVLKLAAERNHLGLLFEPALPDGSLAGTRKGSANLHVVCRGRSAHAGRHFDEGINAIAAAAEIAVRLHALNSRWDGATFNVARIDGGGPLNMVPDVAVVRLNVRYSEQNQETEIAAVVQEILEQSRQTVGADCELHGSFNTPPKPIEGIARELYQQTIDCGQSLGLDLNMRPTGGVCDGNRLAAWGLPNVDTLGPRGGAIHSHDEFLMLDSLTERARLTASLLIGWASGELPWPPDLELTSKDAP